jgi:hypothetical protein
MRAVGTVSPTSAMCSAYLGTVRAVGAADTVGTVGRVRVVGARGSVNTMGAVDPVTGPGVQWLPDSNSEMCV